MNINKYITKKKSAPSKILIPPIFDGTVIKGFGTDFDEKHL